MALLGNQTVQNAVLSISIFEALKEQKESAGIDKKEFWKLEDSVLDYCRYLENGSFF